VADRDAVAKLRIYRALYRLNRSFASIVARCRELRESGMLTREDSHLYACYAQELQADINARLASLMETAESNDHARFGKVTHAYEKELRDPDDVFLFAEERRKEIARQRKTAKGKKAASPAARIHPRRKAARARKGGV
jgi:hypothetical protein